MAARVVGLDIGTHAVRAAELVLGRDGATLARFGQVVLERGAVVDGEVADPPAVAAAIKRLWSEAGFKTKSVIVGVGNQRVVVRQAELSDMSEDDLRSALQFEAQELIPMPVEESLLDFQILERFTGPEGEARMRILLVAAQRDMVRSLLAAVEGADLEPLVVDVVPFALLRAVASTGTTILDEQPTSEAIVSIGAGVTTVLVHESGVPRFVRILTIGGTTLTESVAAELGVELDEAEDLKRRADPASAIAEEARAGQLVADRLGPLLEEIRGSLDFYLAQADAAPVDRLVLTGGASRTPGLQDRLEALIRMPIVSAHPLERLTIGRLGIPETELLDAEPLLAVPIGLALAGRPAEEGRRRLTLLPAEIAAVRVQRRQAFMVAGAVGALAALLLAAWLADSSAVNNERRKANEAEAEAARLERQTASLQDAQALQRQLDQRRALITSALAGDVAWTRLLQQIATVIPNDVWLTSFTASRTSGGGAGSVQIAAMGFDQTSAARWLLRVAELPSLQGLWLTSSAKEGSGPRALVRFQSTANLTPAAESGRASRYAGGKA